MLVRNHDVPTGTYRVWNDGKLHTFVNGVCEMTEKEAARLGRIRGYEVEREEKAEGNGANIEHRILNIEHRTSKGREGGRRKSEGRRGKKSNREGHEEARREEGEADHRGHRGHGEARRREEDLRAVRTGC